MALDAARFDELVAGHQGSVLRVCRAVLGDEALAADAAQDTFLRLWRQFGAQASAHLESPAAWLRRAALSSALDTARRRGVRAWIGSADEGALDAAPASAPTPLELASRGELSERLERALAELPESQRTVFRLRHHAGLPLSEVATLLGLALPTVKTHFARACLKLSASLRAFREDTR